MIAIVDYGMGNLRSAQKGIEKAGHDAMVTDDPAKIGAADAVVLPGVGAFKDCYEGLSSRGLVEPVLEAANSGKPFLGICVGLQLMFEASEEGGKETKGLGILPGRVVRFPAATAATRLKVPHMGWNRLRSVPENHCPLLSELDEDPYVYFVHSYYAQPSDPDILLATCHYGVEFAAIVGKGNVFAVQFHPEKSQTDGLKILRAFGNLIGR